MVSLDHGQSPVISHRHGGLFRLRPDLKFSSRSLPARDLKPTPAFDVIVWNNGWACVRRLVTRSVKPNLAPANIPRPEENARCPLAQTIAVNVAISLGLRAS